MSVGEDGKEQRKEANMLRVIVHMALFRFKQLLLLK